MHILAFEFLSKTHLRLSLARKSKLLSLDGFDSLTLIIKNANEKKLLKL